MKFEVWKKTLEMGKEKRREGECGNETRFQNREHITKFPGFNLHECVKRNKYNKNVQQGDMQKHIEI